MALGVIGGTGFVSLPSNFGYEKQSLDTPFGAPSASLLVGQVDGVDMVYLWRQGEQQSLSPHDVNYRANLYALKEFGVSHVFAVNAVGGIDPGLNTGDWVVPDQLIDYTYGREHTFFSGEHALPMRYVDFATPYDGQLRNRLLSAVKRAQGTESHFVVHEAGTLGVTQGPRLETAAEIRRLAKDDCHVVGMTGMPEAVLARELDMSYVCFALVVNPASGVTDSPLSLPQIHQVVEQAQPALNAVITEMIDTFK